MFAERKVVTGEVEQLIDVLVSLDVKFGNRKQAEEWARKKAEEKPGLILQVVRMLSRLSVQEIKTLKLVEG